MQNMILGGLVGVALVSGCGDDTIETTVLPYAAPCVGLTNQLCLAMMSDGGAVDYAYEGIRGFTHTWGVTTRLRYHVEQVDDPPADGSAKTLVLDEILEVTPAEAGRAFDLAFAHAPQPWFATVGDHLRLVDRVDVACAADVCAAITALDVPDGTYAVDLEFTGDPAAPARALAVAPR
ncbi:MAG: DUF4377 domain-containing protein [Myxococcales bacterium]|nr:DUF4377 domain-containing protein [Myxococcales bacterium]